MKQCQTCRTTYTDDTLRYCLADGGQLVDIGAEEETVVRPGGSASGNRQFETASPKTGGIGIVVKVVIAVLVIGFLGLLALGGAGALYYFNTGTTVVTASPTPTPVSTPQPSPSPWATSTPDDGSDELEKELAELQKKLEEMVKATPGKTTPNDGIAKATVNSPKDGFLALRDEPDAEKGARLAQIPHGAVVTLENCEKEKVTIGGRSGRWCMVTYREQTGWVFDAWLTY